MELDDLIVTKAIIERFAEKLLSYSEVDVAIVGGGPAGLMASYAIAKQGLKVAIFERRLSVGGGMWGGGMMFNEIVVQEEGKKFWMNLASPSENIRPATIRLTRSRQLLLWPRMQPKQGHRSLT